MKPSQNSLFKAATYMRAVAAIGILGLVHAIATNLGGDGGVGSSLVIIIKSGGNNMG